MNKRKLDVDLNLLRIVVLMYELKSLKAVGRKLGRTDSAISKSLAKASEALGKTLFVRSSEGLIPTHYTRSIYPKLKGALALVHEALEFDDFEPSSYTAPIHISMLAQPMAKYGAEILARMRSLFPSSQVEMSTWNNQTPKNLIEDEIDIGLYAMSSNLSADVYQRTIIDDTLTVVIGSKHKSAHWKAIRHWPFIFTRTPGWNDEKFKFSSQFDSLKIDVFTPFIVDDISTCINLLQQGKFAAPYSRQCMLENMQEVDVPNSALIPIKLVSCCKLGKRDAPLQQILHQEIASIVKESAL
ncbi:LysR family transcriptional regulator [Vibrio sp. ZSDE26]|uniref:LysR family transcriptional regulator n=1 Tax=Vibrio amylolyticus TaxID=2847292 RepID=A0A9X2BIJ5_9VIBR|nr:LysR family transcriptional regulator [Vibrio amylolyticus]MCK6262507.1 LysR family transcriptional regulator [Vibrio amylolyticus]